MEIGHNLANVLSIIATCATVAWAIYLFDKNDGGGKPA